MFTDSPVTPARLEVLLELVWEMKSRKLDKEAIRKLLQPKGLPGVNANSMQALLTLKAGQELGLIVEDDNGWFRPGWNTRKQFDARELLLSALDERVLASTDVELWFARFYSYVIARDDKDIVPLGAEAAHRWTADFNKDLYGGTPPENPFNPTKYTGLRRWMRYAGLGWHDSQDAFIPNPYERVKRNLDQIFGKNKKLDSDDFMANLASVCPELDGGAIFREANRETDLHRTCTTALALALRDLHDDRVIKLDCPADSRGWSLSRAGHIRNPSEGLHSDEFDFVERVIQSRESDRAS